MLEALDDVESDLSRFHRIDDMYAMASPRFFRFANRLIYYEGAVRAAMMRYAATLQEQPVPETPTVPVPAPAAVSGDVVVPPSRAALAVSDLGPLLSWG